MNKRMIGLLIYIFWINPAFAQKKDVDIQTVFKILENQQNAWNQADIEAFMEGYWKSDSLKFIGKNGVQYGWKTTLENYKKSYPTADAMGKLTFTILSFDKTSSKSIFMIGKWHLKRKNDELRGYFTLLWKKINGQWWIVADHSS